MKLNRFLVLLLFSLCFVFLFVACNGQKANVDANPSDAAIVRAEGFTINEKTLTAVVPNSCETLSFIDQIEVSKNATWQLSSDIQGTNGIPTKTVLLNEGDNVFYILVNSENGEGISLYSVVIRRRPIYTVVFETNGGTDIASQTVEEDSVVTVPDDPSREKYSFDGWDYDLSRPITSNLTVSAQWSLICSKNLGFASNGDGTCFLRDLENCTDTDVVIPPRSPEGDLVTRIGERAFSNCSDINSVVIPDGVVEIGEDSFSYCSSLTSVFIPESVTRIGNGAFCGCSSLTSISIPESVTRIGNDAFSGCSSLTSISIPESVTEIGECAFGYCDALTSIVIPDSVTVLGRDALFNCLRLQSVVIGDGITELKDGFCAWCYNLVSLTVGKNIVKIEEDAFDGCNKLIEIRNYSSLNIETGSAELGKVGRYAKRIFKDGESLLAETDDGYLFYEDENEVFLIAYNGSDTELTLPNGYNGKDYAVYDNAFFGYSGLTSVVIPDRVTCVRDSAFFGCPDLTSVTIGQGVESIESYAFSNCPALSSLTFLDGIESIGRSAFANCDALVTVTMPNSIKTILFSAFYDCTNLTSVILGQGISRIVSFAFDNCSSLESVTFTNSGAEWSVVKYDADNNIIESVDVTVSDPTVNALRLRDTYCDNYYWIIK